MFRCEQNLLATMLRPVCLLALVASLVACAQTPGAGDAAGVPVHRAKAETGSLATPADKAAGTEKAAASGKANDLVRDSGLVQTASQPFNDLNLVRSDIPPVLLAALKAPYAEPAGHSCTTLASELQALDLALGSDQDAKGQADPNLVERAVDAVGQAAVGTVKSTVNTVVDGVIPFRSWVRKLSGAEEHSSTAAAALQAGVLRRAYLKGWGEGTGCNKAAPAKPEVAASPG